MKVWMLFAGYDGHTFAIYSTEEKAREAMPLWNGCCEPESVEVDEFIFSGKIGYRVGRLNNGVAYANQADPDDEGDENFIWARDREQALRVAEGIAKK